jgi:hypothetical protein
MAKDLTIVLQDEPGQLARLGEATGDAGVNIQGMCATTAAGMGEIHLLVEDVAGARAALEGAGMEVNGERDVLVVEIEDRPGTMAEVAKKIADAGANVNLAYTTFGGVKLVLGVDDLEKARSAV